MKKALVKELTESVKTVQSSHVSEHKPYTQAMHMRNHDYLKFVDSIDAFPLPHPALNAKCACWRAGGIGWVSGD